MLTMKVVQRRPDLFNQPLPTRCGDIIARLARAEGNNGPLSDLGIQHWRKGIWCQTRTAHNLLESRRSGPASGQEL